VIEKAGSIGFLEFQERFSTEEACERQLKKIRWAGGYRCPRCGCRRYSYHSTRKLYQCRACRYQASLTAGTVFPRTKAPLRKWFAMIFLMANQKSGVSMPGLQKMLDIKACKTVWLMGHKIRKAMADSDVHYKPGSLIEFDDAFFQAGQDRTGSQSRQSPALGAHFDRQYQRQPVLCPSRRNPEISGPPPQ